MKIFENKTELQDFLRDIKNDLDVLVQIWEEIKEKVSYIYISY